MKNVLQILDLETGKFLYNVPLAIGSVDGVHGRKKSNELFFKFSSMVNPGVIYFVDMAKEAPVPEVCLVKFLLLVLIDTFLKTFYFQAQK